jgi:hypothetical protein
MSEEQPTSSQLFGQAAEHDKAVKQLEAEAAAAGRRLTPDDQAYMADLHKESSKLLTNAAEQARQEMQEGLGQVVVDGSGVVMTPKEQEAEKAYVQANGEHSSETTTQV